MHADSIDKTFKEHSRYNGNATQYNTK